MCVGTHLPERNLETFLIYRSPRLLLYIGAALFHHWKLLELLPILPSVAVYSEKAQRTVVSLLALAFRSSHRFSQAFMRWLSLSSEVQLSFESMVPWLPPPPMPWLPGELPREPSANWREIETLLTCLKFCFQRRLTPHTSLWHSNSNFQSCPNSLHLLYHLMLITTPQAGVITPSLQKRIPRLASISINTSSFLLQSLCFFLCAGLPSLQNIEIRCL